MSVIFIFIYLKKIIIKVALINDSEAFKDKRERNNSIQRNRKIQETHKAIIPKIIQTLFSYLYYFLILFIVNCAFLFDISLCAFPFRNAST